MRRRFDWLFYAAAASLLLCWSAPALGDDASSAREHFARGYTLAESGNPDAAIREFEQAYAASPNPTVLYNLGQAYAAAGRSSDAIETLQQYLRVVGSAAGDARIRQVSSVLEYHAARVAKVTVTVEPVHAVLTVDGRTLDPGSHSLTLDPGPHGIWLSAPHFEPKHARVDVIAHENRELTLTLEPRPEPAQLLLVCSLRDVRVSVDGGVRGLAANARNIVLESGTHRIRLERDGYLPDEQTVELSPGETLAVYCRLAVDPKSPQQARLTVVHPQGTSLLLDSNTFVGGLVPPGAHELRVSGSGYVTELRQFALSPRQVAKLTVLPERASDVLSRAQAQARKRLRLASYVSAGAGVLSGALAAILYLDNHNRYAAWQEESRQTVRTLPEDPNAASRLDALLAEENSIRKRDSWALGLSVFSCSAVAASALLFIASRDDRDQIMVTTGALTGLRYQRSF